MQTPVCSNRDLWASVPSLGPLLKISWISSLCQTTGKQRMSHFNHPVPAFLLQQSRVISICYPSMSKGCGEGNLVIMRLWVKKNPNQTTTTKNTNGSNITTHPRLGLLGWRICNPANAYHLVVCKSGMLELEEIPRDYLV